MLAHKLYITVDTPLQQSRYTGPGFKIPPDAEILISFVCVFKSKCKENELMANPRIVKIIIKICSATFLAANFNILHQSSGEREISYSFLLEERKSFTVKSNYN